MQSWCEGRMPDRSKTGQLEGVVAGVRRGKPFKGLAKAFHGNKFRVHSMLTHLRARKHRWRLGVRRWGLLPLPFPWNKKCAACIDIFRTRNERITSAISASHRIFWGLECWRASEGWSGKWTVSLRCFSTRPSLRPVETLCQDGRARNGKRVQHEPRESMRWTWWNWCYFSFFFRRHFE